MIITLVSIFIGIFLGKNLAKLKLGRKYAALKERNYLLDRSLNETNDELKNTQLEKEALIATKTRLATELKNSDEKIAKNKEELNTIQEKFTKEFENLANKILEEKSTKFTEQNKLNITSILNPLKEKIEGFEKKVSESQKESVGMHSALKEQLNSLKDLNLQMSKEAINLTKALKGDSKAQGDWGETQLEILLEKANLVKDIHFTTQGGYRDEDGRLKKPDFIINLPDKRHLIVDSKVSLTNYEAYFNADNEEQKKIHLKKHIESIRKHIRELSEKKYESLYEINAPDYVLMFVPIEPAYLLALNNNNSLYLEALDKNVVMVSTSTLLATLSTVSSMWRQENQKKNVLEIANQAGRLYDQFVNLTDDLIKVGTQLKTVQGSYDTSMKKLTGKGNLVNKVEKIRELGAKTSKIMNKNLLDRASEA
ncbi:DNA recombination protein RmuC [Flavobacteriaceae bacterium]|nr:DNA recombination protein RmuC [Flavobacteriaceae bacterium]MDB2418001.1 DNA recombination protein RmuC [Flavobacteriaceae bacterium]MDB2657903.1 DNA recombination protein RmuC [Flavobacteriaceae bacterium]